MAEKRDYFNLESSEEEEEEEKSEQRDDGGVNKWDWDKRENFDLYFKSGRGSSSLKRESNDQEVESTVKKSKSERSSQDLVGHTASVNRIHWSKKSNPDLLLSSSMDNTIIIWNVKSRQQVKCLSDVHAKSVRNAIWSNSECEIISVSYDQTCALVDAETGKEMARFRHDKYLTAVCNHPREDGITLLGSKNEIIAWDHRSPSNYRVYKSCMNQVQELMFLDDTSFVSSGDVVSHDSPDYSLIVWDYESTARLSAQIFHERFVCTSLIKHPHRSVFYAQTHGNYVCEFMTRRPYKMNKTKRFASGHVTQGYSIGIDLNSSGNWLASGSTDSSIYIYDTNTTKLFKKLDMSRSCIKASPCMDVKFKCNQDTLAASFYSGRITLVDI